MRYFCTKRVSPTTGDVYYIYLDSSLWDNIVYVDRIKRNIIGLKTTEQLLLKRITSLSEAIRYAEDLAEKFPNHPLFKHNENTTSSHS